MARGAQGEGSVYQRATDGRWVATVFLGYNPGTGKRVRRAFYATSQREALRKRKQFLRDLEEGVATPSRRGASYTVAQWMDYWLEHVIEPVREPTTLETYRDTINNHLKPYLGELLLVDLTTEHVEAWLQQLHERQVGVRTRQLALARLRTALKEALSRRQQTGVRFNAATPARTPRSQRKTIPPPSIADARALLHAARGERLEALIIVLLGLGLRRGEAIGLRWEDIDLGERTLKVRRRVSRVLGQGVIVREGTKMHPGQTQTIAMPKMVVEALRAHRARQVPAQLPSGYVFTGPTGKVLDPQRAYEFFQVVRHRAGLEHKTMHHLRHDSASLMLAEGVPLWAVSQILRHSGTQVTSQYYAHITPEVLRDAADKMDQVLGPLMGEGAGRG